MHRLPPSLSLLPDEPFRFVGGHLAADLVNTVNWESDGLRRDRLADHDRLVEWALAASAVDRRQAAAIRRSARAEPDAAAAALAEARWLRDVLRRLLHAVARGSVRDAAGSRALADFDAILARTLRHLRLAVAPRRASPLRSSPRHGADAGPLAWAWDDDAAGAAARPGAMLRPVAWEAARLLASPDSARLRVCDGPDCGWVYVDRSRNGFRRWCEMQTCGTHEKSRRRAARSRS